MLGQGRGAVFAAPHILLYPGLALALTVLAFNLLGEALQEPSTPASAAEQPAAIQEHREQTL